jgi:hypothetical protein
LTQELGNATMAALLELTECWTVTAVSVLTW